MLLPTLIELMQFKHPQVIQSYVRTRGGDVSRAEALFVDMLKYLWVSCKHTYDQKEHPGDDALRFSFVMHQEMREIDEMWHNFILYTKDYTDFCGKYFGAYLHHQPDIAIGVIPNETEFSAEMEKYLEYVFDNLGEQTVRQWFAAVI